MCVAIRPVGLQERQGPTVDFGRRREFAAETLSRSACWSGRSPPSGYDAQYLDRSVLLANCCA